MASHCLGVGGDGTGHIPPEALVRVGWETVKLFVGCFFVLFCLFTSENTVQILQAIFLSLQKKYKNNLYI